MMTVCLRNVARRPVLISSLSTRLLNTSSTFFADNSGSDARPFSEIPGPSGRFNWPIIGPAFHFKPLGKHSFERIDKLFSEIHDKYGPIVKVNLGQWILFLDNPTDMETALRSEGKYPDHLQIDMMVHYYEKNKKVKPLSMSSGEEWQNLRSKVQQKYTRPRATFHYLPTQNRVADDLMKHLAGKQMSAEEFKDIAFRYVTENICAVFFNKRMGFLAEGSEYEASKKRFIEETHNLFEVMGKPPGPPLYKIFPTADYKKLGTALDYVTGEARRYVTEANEELLRKEKEGTLDTDDPNLLLALLASKKLSLEEVYSVMTENIYAGTDGTTKTLLLFLFNLARFPEKQEKLYDEIKSVVGSEGDLTEVHINNLPYLRASLKESMRMAFTLASGPSRTLPQDTVIGGYNIPKGTNYMLSCRRLLMNDKYFDHPESFLPERWLRGPEGQREKHIPSVAFLPFGFGPRICLGRRFAEQIIYLAICKIISNYKISLHPKSTDVEVVYQLFATTNKPVEFILTKRD